MSKARIWVLSILGVLAVGVGIWQFYKYKLVHSKIEDAVAKTHGLYSLHYEDLVIDEVAGTVHVKNVIVEPDTAVYTRLEAEGKNPSVLIRARIPSLSVEGVKTPKALLSRQIEGRIVEIDHPDIVIITHKAEKDTTVYNPAGDLSKDLLGKLLKIQVDSIRVLHGNVEMRKMGANTATVSAKDISCTLKEVLIDSLTGKDSSRILFSRGVSLYCGEVLLPSKNKKYKWHIAECSFESKENTLGIGQLRLIPQLAENAFAASFPVQKDRYNFSLSGISIRHINREALWHKRIEADSIVIDESSFKIFRDLSYPKDTVSKVGRYPQQQLMKLKIPVNFRKVIFRHSFIEYKERNARSDSAGKLQFYDASATISNVTNIRKRLARDNACVLQFRAKLLNKAPVDARIVMLTGDPSGMFTISGNIGAIHARDLNVLTEPMGLARLERGRVNKLHFDLKGTDSTSDGKLLFLYDDIKVSLLKKGKDDGDFDKKGLVSFFAGIIMKKSNPKRGKDEPRVVEVHFQRIMYKSFFNLIWKSIFTGIKESAGM